MSEVKHSPLPWEVLDRRSAPLKNIKIMSGFQVVGEVAAVHQRDPLAGYRADRDSVVADVVDELGLANAEYIVEACNAHPALTAENEALRERVVALEEFCRWIAPDEGILFECNANYDIDGALVHPEGPENCLVCRARALLAKEGLK